MTGNGVELATGNDFLKGDDSRFIELWVVEADCETPWAYE